MYLTQRLISLARSQSVLKTLTSSFATLSVTPPLVQQQKSKYSTKLKTATTAPSESEQCNEVFSKIYDQVARGEEGRLFGIVHLCGKQFKVTAGDIILVEGYWPPTIGDEIRLEKVLLVGGRDFTLIGAPMLTPGLVDIKATIIEKTLAHTKTHFKKKRRKQYTRINFQRSPNTMIRINSVNITSKPDETCTPINEKRIF